MSSYIIYIYYNDFFFAFAGSNNLISLFIYLIMKIKINYFLLLNILLKTIQFITTTKNQLNKTS